jgi:hypothetical protein
MILHRAARFYARIGILREEAIGDRRGGDPTSARNASGWEGRFHLPAIPFCGSLAVSVALCDRNGGSPKPQYPVPFSFHVLILKKYFFEQINRNIYWLDNFPR